MNEYELCKAIRKLIINRAAEVMCYNWSDDFSAKKIRELVEKIQEKDGFRSIDVRKLTDAEMEELGFGMWSDETKLRLIPLWLSQFIIEDAGYVSISGEPIVKSKMDNGHRFGCLAYGIVPVEV